MQILSFFLLVWNLSWVSIVSLVHIKCNSTLRTNQTFLPSVHLWSCAGEPAWLVATVRQGRDIFHNTQYAGTSLQTLAYFVSDSIFVLLCCPSCFQPKIEPLLAISTLCATAEGRKKRIKYLQRTSEHPKFRGFPLIFILYNWIIQNGSSFTPFKMPS